VSLFIIADDGSIHIPPTKYLTLGLPSFSKLHLCMVVMGIEGMTNEEEAATQATVAAAMGLG